MTFYKNLYNKLYADGYHKSNEFAGYPLINLMEKHHRFQEEETILDVGCSNGMGIAKIKEAAGRTTIDCYGFDPAEKAIQYCKTRHGDNNSLRYKVGALPNIPFEDNKFDTIFSADVLEHLLPEDSNSAIKEMVRVTKDNANIFLNIALVIESGRRKGWNKIMEEFDIKDLHTNLKSSKEWLQIFDSNNLVVKKIDIDILKRDKHIGDVTIEEGSETMLCIQLIKK